MKQVLAFLALLLLGGVGFAADVEIKGEVKYKPHTLVRLSVDAPPTSTVLWDVWPFDAKADIATTSGNLLQFAAPPGEYVIQATVYESADGKMVVQRARVKVNVGDDKPTPPPLPPTPNPTSDLAKELSALYAADGSTTKQPDLMLLTELYRQAVELSQSPNVSTLGQLAKQVSDAGSALLPRGRLDPMRRVIAKHVAKQFGEEDATLTDELRSKAAGVYRQIHTALVEIGGGA